MREKFYQKDGNLVVEIPLKTHRYNPYEAQVDENYQHGEEMDNLIGVVEGEWEMGLCFRLDMDYKGKQDQFSDYVIKWHDGLESFQKLCEDLKIDIVFNNYETKFSSNT